MKHSILYLIITLLASSVALSNPSEILRLEGFKDPLLQAIFENDIEKIEALVRDRAVNLEVIEQGNFPLLAAARLQNMEALALLLAAGANPNQMLATGHCALFTLANVGNIGLFKLLLASGANLNLQTESGATALHVAAYNGQWDMARFLLSLDGIEIDSGTLEGYSVLWLALISGQTEFAREMLRRGANINRTNKEGQTYLHFAAELGDIELARTLLELGADPTIIDHLGFYARDLANVNGHAEIFRLISDGALLTLVSLEADMPVILLGGDVDLDLEPLTLMACPFARQSSASKWLIRGTGNKPY